MKFNSFFYATLVIGAFVCFTSCQKTNTPDDILIGQKEFDVDLFENNLKSGMGDQWVGYSYIISKNGQYERGGYFGKRRTGSDGNHNSSHVVPYYAASINKTISAVAMLKVLQDKNNGDAGGFLNAKIAQFLPPNWTFGANAADISFRDLLEHKSGIPANGATDYSGLRTLIGSGTSAQKNYQYSNANYALIRILVARMSGNTGTDNLQNDGAMSEAVLKGFRRYVDTQLFDPIGIDADTKDNSISSTMYYKFGSAEAGWNMGEMEERLGSGGYFLSAKDIANFLAYLNHTETLISKATRKTMFDNFLGWSDEILPQNEPVGTYGRYYFKSGSLCDDASGGNCDGRGVRNIIGTFPFNDVEVVIMANSRGGNMDSSSGLRNMLRTAYDNAWVE